MCNRFFETDFRAKLFFFSVTLTFFELTNEIWLFESLCNLLKTIDLNNLNISIFINMTHKLFNSESLDEELLIQKQVGRMTIYFSKSSYIDNNRS